MHRSNTRAPQAGSNVSPSLRLYIAGTTPNSRAAHASLMLLLENPEFAGRVRRKVIDVLREPRRAALAGVMATPTVIVDSRGQTARFVGDLSRADDLIAYLRRSLYGDQLFI